MSHVRLHRKYKRKVKSQRMISFFISNNSDRSISYSTGQLVDKLPDEKVYRREKEREKRVSTREKEQRQMTRNASLQQNGNESVTLSILSVDKDPRRRKKNNNAHIYPCLLFLSSLRSKNTCDLCRGLIVISDYAVNKRHHRRIDL